MPIFDAKVFSSSWAYFSSFYLNFSISIVSTLPEIYNYVNASSNDLIFKSFILISFSAIYNMYFNSEIENSLLTFALFLIYLAL
jgi:subtilase family serine protease